MNFLQYAISLRNQYFALRHGESVANEEKVIISNPQDGKIYSCGLTINGRLQARDAARKAFSEGLRSNDLIIVHSEFYRAKETAEIFHDEIQEKTSFALVEAYAPEIFPAYQLRERYFGQFDKTSDKNYSKIWDLDKKDPEHQEFQVESVLDVLMRTTWLVTKLDATYQDKKIVLVSHGDPLQILHTGFAKVDPATHRSLPNLNTAELRELQLG